MPNVPWFQIVVYTQQSMVKAFCRRCSKYVETTTHSHIGNPLNPRDRQHNRAGGRFADGRF